MGQGCIQLVQYSPAISRINRALSPMYLSTMAEDTTFRKFASMFDAMAFASSVLPVPGGPERSAATS
jgi:hypothetical protein